MNKLLSLVLIMAACGCFVDGFGSLFGRHRSRDSHSKSGDAKFGKSHLSKDKNIGNLQDNGPKPDVQQDIPDFPDYPCWIKTIKTNYPGLVQVPYYNLDSCLRYCISLDQCSIVDYDYGADPPCWIQSVAGTVKMETLKEHPQSTSYILDRSCLQPRLVPYNVGLCWSMREKYNYDGLKSVPYTNLPSCLNYCANSAGCFMVDYDPTKSPPCNVWEDQGPFDASKFGNHASASNFLLDRDCLTYFNFTEYYESELCWTVREKSHYSDLIQASFTTVEGCMSHCENSPKCSVVDFDSTSNPPCWVQTDGSAVDLNKLKPQDSATDYILDRTCA